jgi:hypothetical protein
MLTNGVGRLGEMQAIPKEPGPIFEHTSTRHELKIFQTNLIPFLNTSRQPPGGSPHFASKYAKRT